MRTAELNEEEVSTPFDALTAEYIAWCDRHRLPPLSPDELLSDVYATSKDEVQIEWLRDYIRRWEEAEDAEQDARESKNPR